MVDNISLKRGIIRVFKRANLGWLNIAARVSWYLSEWFWIELADHASVWSIELWSLNWSSFLSDFIHNLDDRSDIFGWEMLAFDSYSHYFPDDLCI